VLKYGLTCSSKEFYKQDQQGKAAFIERNPTRLSNKNQRPGAQDDPKQKQDRAQGRART
jgi:hypothetical protein